MSLTPFSIGMPPCSKCAVVTCGMSSSGGSARPPVNSAERGAGAGDGAWEKPAGCREAGGGHRHRRGQWESRGLPGSGRGTGRRCYDGDGGLGRIGMCDRGGPLFG